MSAELFTEDAVLAALVHHTGEANGITARDLTLEVAGIFATTADERRLRTVIEQLRRDGHPICGHPATGYFHASSEAELLRTCEFLYSRAMTSMAQIAAMRRVSIPDFRGQLRLPAMPHPLNASQPEAVTP